MDLRSNLRATLLLRLHFEEKMLQDGRNIENVQTLDFLKLVFGDEFWTPWDVLLNFMFSTTGLV